MSVKPEAFRNEIIVQFKRALLMRVNLFSCYSFYDFAGIYTSEPQDCAPSSHAANSHFPVSPPTIFMTEKSVFCSKSFPQF
jgi:hypothetical protein